MQFTVNVDCTPDEARAFLGLPDLKPIQEHYVQVVMDSMSGAGSLDQMQEMLRKMSPFGDAGLKMFGKMMDLGMASTGVRKD